MIIKHLRNYRYEPHPITSGLWKNQTRDMHVTLFVDDVLTKYTNIDGVYHLVKLLKDVYDITTDWEVQLYCRISLKRD